MAHEYKYLMGVFGLNNKIGKSSTCPHDLKRKDFLFPKCIHVYLQDIPFPFIN